MLVAAVAALALAGCTQQAEPEPSPPVRPAFTEQDVVYREVDGESIALDACLPETTEPTASVVLVHGGGFVEGSKSLPDFVRLCEQLADAGFAAFSIDYRLAPEHIHPAALEDLQSAIAWLREPEQTERYLLDPDRIGALGGSAGAVLVNMVGTMGEGSTTEGSRIAAAVSISGVGAFTTELFAVDDAYQGYIDIGLQYFGCVDAEDCPQAYAASPVDHVDPTDPPFYLLASAEELLPEQQSEVLAAALEEVGVEIEQRVDPGDEHSTQILDEEYTAEIIAFFDEHLGAEQ